MPIGAKVAVLPSKDEVKTNLILPDSVKKKISPYSFGSIVSVGRGTKAEPTDHLKAGQVVMFGVGSGVPVTINDVEYIVLEAGDIILEA